MTNIRRCANRLLSFATAIVVLTPIAFDVGAASATGAGGSGTQVATMTRGLSGAGGTQTWWYSEDGTTGVVTNVNVAGQVVSVEKVVYGIRDNHLVHTNTAVFPLAKSWATYTSSGSGYCVPGPCYDDNWLYPSPSLLRRFIADHQMRFEGNTERFDGRPIRELDAASNIETWADPTNDEIARYEDDSGAVLTYRWLEATAANRAHLTVSVPAAYTELSSTCAVPVGSPTPPGLGSGDPCSS